ncbi:MULTISPECIES: hypothetical protein [unclassified Stenotrophomonas]|uniref:hypothetical protein n=1 Tax=unclassified Stenotrophomonas TaxID=196198 RepID=UPI0021597CF2|nr:MULTISPECIES: hypothetical protein [unclassified Stenotrophomonas]
MKIAVRRSLALAVASSLALAAPVYAGTLNPGESATVQPGDVPETWTLNNAQLTVNPGGTTLDIAAREQSKLTISGAEVSGASGPGMLRLLNSDLIMSNSTVVNTNGRGFSLAIDFTSQLPASTASITNSQITGLGAGVSVIGPLPGQRSVLTLDRSQVTGLANAGANAALAGNGIVAFEGSDIRVTNGSVVTGAQNGIYAVGSTQQGSGADASDVVIDASKVEGKGGAHWLWPRHDRRSSRTRGLHSPPATAPSSSAATATSWKSPPPPPPSASPSTTPTSPATSSTPPAAPSM